MHAQGRSPTPSHRAARLLSPRRSPVPRPQVFVSFGFVLCAAVCYQVFARRDLAGAYGMLQNGSEEKKSENESEEIPLSTPENSDRTS